MSSLLNNHVNLFKQISESDQLQLIAEASSAVGYQVVIPTGSNEQFRVRKYTELLNNLPGDPQRNFIIQAEKKLSGHRHFKGKAKDPRPQPPPRPPPPSGNVAGGSGRN